jgi:light-harvesting complex 1 beta chain
MPKVAGLHAPLVARPFVRSVLMAERKSISGMSDEEAQEFHAYYMQGLVWAWRPWIT